MFFVGPSLFVVFASGTFGILVGLYFPLGVLVFWFVFVDQQNRGERKLIKLSFSSSFRSPLFSLTATSVNWVVVCFHVCFHWKVWWRIVTATT